MNERRKGGKKYERKERRKERRKEGKKKGKKEVRKLVLLSESLPAISIYDNIQLNMWDRVVLIFNNIHYCVMIIRIRKQGIKPRK